MKGQCAPGPAMDAPATFPVLPRLPPRAFRLGVTSYVHPADVLPNVEALCGQVEDIELVLFESDDVSNLPPPAVVERLAALAEAGGHTYTVHFPIDRKLGAESADERAALRGQMLRILERTRPLHPCACILHLEGIGPAADAARVRQWQRDTDEEIARLLEGGARPDLFCVENLGYPFEWCAPAIEKYGLAVCVDIGHLWRYGVDAQTHLRTWLPRTRVVHLHGERGGRDHIALGLADPARLDAALRALGGYSGVVTLELFDYAAVLDSLGVLAAWLEKEKRISG